MSMFDSPDESAESRPFTPEEVALLLRLGSAAPSLYNSQPWRFVVADHEVRIFTDPERSSPAADPYGRQQVIACGSALLNIRLAIRHFGHQPMVSIMPSSTNSRHVATARRGAAMEIGSTERKLYAQIMQRRTNRMPFAGRPIETAARQAIRYSAAVEGGWLRPVDSSEDREIIIDLLVRAIRAQRLDLTLATEMSRWLHSGPSRDGMPVSAWRGAKFPVPGLDPAVEMGNWEHAIARTVRRQTFFILATPLDAEADWLTAGQALQRLLLNATQLELSASFFNQIIEAPELRTELAERLGMQAVPQMMLRVGYPAHRVHHSPGRRPLDEIIDDPAPH